MKKTLCYLRRWGKVEEYKGYKTFPRSTNVRRGGGGAEEFEKKKKKYGRVTFGTKLFRHILTGREQSKKGEK